MHHMGTCKPGPFIRHLYPMLSEVEDGFLNRFFFRSPQTRLLMEDEVDEWCIELKR